MDREKKRVPRGLGKFCNLAGRSGLGFAKSDGIFVIYSGIVVVGLCAFGLDGGKFEVRNSKFEIRNKSELVLVGVAPFIETFVPLLAKADFEIGVEVLEGVLLVASEGVDVFLEGWLEGAEIREAEVLIDFADLADGIALELFESDLAVISGGNQEPVFEKGVIHHAV